MRDCNEGRFRQQVNFVRRQFLQDGGQPLSDILSRSEIEQALKAVGDGWIERIYTPLVTWSSPLNLSQRD